MNATGAVTFSNSCAQSAPQLWEVIDAILSAPTTDQEKDDQVCQRLKQCEKTDQLHFLSDDENYSPSKNYPEARKRFIEFFQKASLDSVVQILNRTPRDLPSDALEIFTDALAGDLDPRMITGELAMNEIQRERYAIRLNIFYRINNCPACPTKDALLNRFQIHKE